MGGHCGYSSGVGKYLATPLPSYATGCVNRSVVFICLFNCFLSGKFISVVFNYAILGSHSTVSNNKGTQEDLTQKEAVMGQLEIHVSQIMPGRFD
jgi:hypothetical protein